MLICSKCTDPTRVGYRVLDDKTAKSGSARNARKSSTRDVHRNGGSGGKMAVLRDRFHQEIVPQLREQYRYKSPMQIPRLAKIIINMGLGEAIQNIKILDSAAAELSQISGQKPVITRARQSIAAFKLRKGMPIGCMVTLQRQPDVRVLR